MSTDLDRRIADLRSTPTWNDEDRRRVLDEILATDPAPQRTDVRLMINPTRRRPRARVLVAAAGLAAAACIAVPAVLPSGTTGGADRAAAAALHHLARVAAASPVDATHPGKYLHIVEVDSQRALNGQPAERGRYESWIRPDGKTWQKRTESAPVARTEVWLLPAGPPRIDGMNTPQRLDRLPTDPVKLDYYLRTHTVGSTSADERVFVAVVDIVRRGSAPARLRAAALDVLARLGHVRIDGKKHDSAGHPVQAFDFVDPHGRPGDVRTIMFSTRTAQITEEVEHFDGKVFFTRVVSVFETVNAVPASIRDRAIPQR